MCIYALLILLTFHGLYCFAAAVTDRDKVRGGKDLSVAQAAGRTIALSQTSLQCINTLPVSNTQTNVYTHFLASKVNWPLASQEKESKNK